MANTGLTPNELREWKSLKAKSKRYHIPVKRTSTRNSNVEFSGGVYAQLGTGRATSIMNARIKLRKIEKR